MEGTRSNEAHSIDQKGIHCTTITIPCCVVIGSSDTYSISVSTLLAYTDNAPAASVPILSWKKLVQLKLTVLLIQAATVPPNPR